MNRKEIKEKAKSILKENFKSFWVGYLIIIAISLLLNMGIELLFGNESIISMVLSLVSSFFNMTLSVGFYSYLLKMIHKEKYDRNDIFKYIGKVLPIVSISLLVVIFCLLWSILFIIPGIIAALSYTMVYLIYAENAEDSNLTAMDYLQKSKEMMNGYKWDYFIFSLSFIGWILLSLLTCGILFIWTMPYITIAEVVYYDELKRIKSKE